MPVPIPPQSEAGSLALSASDPAMPASSPPEGFTQGPGVTGVSNATSPVQPLSTPSASVQPTALIDGSTEAMPVLVWSASALDVRAPEWLNRFLTALSTALAVAVKHRLMLLGSLATLAAVATVIATTPPPPESASRAPTASPARSASGGSGVPTPTAGSVSSTATASGETSAAVVSPSPKEMAAVSVDELVAASWDRDWVEAIRVLQEYLGTRGGSDAYASGKLYDALVQYGIVLVGLQQPADAIDTWKQAEALDAGRPDAPQRIRALSARLAGQGAEEAQTAEVAVTATAISSPTPRVSVTASPVRGLGTPSPVRATEPPVEAPEAVDVPISPAPSVTKPVPAGAVSRNQDPTQTVRSTATAVVRSTVTPKPTASPAPTSTNRPAPTAPPVPTATVPPPRPHHRPRPPPRCPFQRLHQLRPRRNRRRLRQSQLPRSCSSALSSSSLHRISSPRPVPPSSSAGSRCRVPESTGFKCASRTIAGRTSGLNGLPTKFPCRTRQIAQVPGCGGWPQSETMTGLDHGLNSFGVFPQTSPVVTR